MKDQLFDRSRFLDIQPLVDGLYLVADLLLDCECFFIFWLR